jgi:hypothetical protein
MSSIEEIREISRAVRELRANLMARLEARSARAQSASAPAAAEETETDAVYATLHPPELALSEAALAQPGPARKLDPAWLRAHLLTARVELRSRTALAGLDGDLRRIRLVDGKGTEHEALELELRRDSQGLAYLIQFPAHAFDPGGAEDRLRFTLRLGLDDGEQTASWTVPRQTLESLDELPLVYYLARLRTLRWARALLLTGGLGEARRQASEVRVCAPDLSLAEKLEAALGEGVKGSAEERVRVDLTALARLDHLGVLAELGHDPARDLARRAGLLGLVEERAHRRGLVPSAELQAARGALREAALALERGALGWGMASALHRFDRQLTRILAAVLDPLAAPRAPEGPSRGALLLEGLPAVSERELELELGRRVALANAGLVPAWVQSPRDPDPETHATTPRFRRAELHPVLEVSGAGGRSLCELHQRLGWGWTGLGVPPHRYQTRFVDRGSAYWKAELADKRSLAALRPGAERLLQLAVVGPEDGSAIASDGLAQLQGASVRPLLLSQVLDPRATRQRAAGALRALGRIPGQETAAALAQAVRSPHGILRAAALEAIGARGLAEERGMLRAGLEDQDHGAAAAALTGLLRVGDLEGTARARRWLQGDRRSLALRAILDARSRVSAIPRAWGPLAASLLALLGKEGAVQLLVPTAALLEARAQPALSRLYDRDPALRSAILALPQVTGEAFEKLLRRAAVDPSPELRRLAFPKLTGLKLPPRALLEEALKDGDRGVRMAAHVALAKLGRTDSLLALGEGARGSCEERALTLAPLSEAMEPASRSKLLADALATACPDAQRVAFRILARHHAKDVGLLRIALAHPRRDLRVRTALLVLGLSVEAVSGQTP